MTANRNISNETRTDPILWDVRSPPAGPKYLNPIILYAEVVYSTSITV